LWGLFKKIVIADRLALFVDMAFNNVGMHSGITHIVATWFFCIQVYCDFSGYSDIAIGTAKIMGVDLMVNFNKIYWSKSVTEYWQRNHISLTTWFRDYLYFPLGGGRVPTWRKYLNVMIIFLVSGLWHGAAWTFVFWGALNGFYLVYELATRSIRAKVDKALGFYKIPRIKGLVRILLTFNVIAFGLFFFRSNSMQDAGEMFSIVSSGDLGVLSYGSLSDFVYGIFGIFVLFAVEYIQRDKTLERGIGDLPLYGRWGLYVFLCMSILMIGVFDGGQFIYFQF